MKRCSWCNLKNEKYVNYHDNEWCILNKDEKYLYEMFILESSQAGLSWECVLNKREAFLKAYDGFDINKVVNFDDKKIEKLMDDKEIIRNRLKIQASINNSKIYLDIIFVLLLVDLFFMKVEKQPRNSLIRYLLI